jgi:hypothetical protein
MIQRLNWPLSTKPEEYIATIPENRDDVKSAKKKKKGVRKEMKNCSNCCTDLEESGRVILTTVFGMESS